MRGKGRSERGLLKEGEELKMRGHKEGQLDVGMTGRE